MTMLKSALEVELLRRGHVTIRPSNHVATGGEGSVYRLNDTIVKLYTDPDKMSHDTMGEKIRELSRITHPQIVKPLGLVLHKGREVGYYMNYISAEPLSRMFTNDFIVRSGITKSDTEYVVRHMRDIVCAAHKAGAIMVDANELNWLVQLRQKESPLPYVIDVDSWAIGKWGASVIMPSIRDWHSSVFDQKSDWFAWGVVTFQLFTGIHPYKGTLSGYERGKLEERMKANASVFTQGVQLPRTVRDFSLIPKGLCAWYESVFKFGVREAPPSNFDQAVAYKTGSHVYHRTITKTESISYTKLFDAGNDTIVKVFPCGVIALSNGLLINSDTKKEIGRYSSCVEVVDIEYGYIILDYKSKQFVCTFFDKKDGHTEGVTLPCSFDKIIRFKNRLFGVTNQGMAEFVFHRFSSVLCSVKNIWNALPYATEWFDGFGIQKTFTSVHVIYPYGDQACAYIRISELDRVSILQGVRGVTHLVVTGINPKGEMNRYDVFFSKDYKTYQCVITSMDTPDITRVTLSKGVSIEIVDDGRLVVFIPGSGKETIIEDKDILSGAKLYVREHTVLYVLKGTMWSISMQ